MVRKKQDVTVDTPEMTMEQLLAENQKLQAEKARMEQTIADLGNTGSDPMAMKFMNEVAQIKRVARVDTDKIKVKEFTDHKNISLWRKDGKRIGPMHRDNALATLNSFYNIGILLSTKQPTQEEIDAWKQTPEGQKFMEAESKKREMNLKTLKRGELEKILKAMTQQFGLTADTLMSLKKQNEILTATEGRKAAGV